MLHLLYIYSKSRRYWILLTFSIIVLMSITLSIQYFFLTKPCILCVYQRCALCGIAIAGIISTTAPHIPIIRLIGISIWVYSATKGLIFAKKHTYLMLYPLTPFLTCDLFVDFPNWLPLNKWWPAVFNTDGINCVSSKWYFLSLEMSQWMCLIFISYLIIVLCMIISHIMYYK